ncbi:hypothetical protein B1R27_35690, partial [Streptomyces sp. GKU 895]
QAFLGAAGPGDTALFWFSGHGSERVATGTELLVEATGRSQALVCVDGPLSDKRLGALLDEVAGRGAHVVAVLDCCFSGGATREDRVPADLTARHAPARPEWPVARDSAPPRGAPAICCSPRAGSTNCPTRAGSTGAARASSRSPAGRGAGGGP